MTEHEELKQENRPQMVLEIGLIAGAGKTEHYEMASYTMLAQMAKDLGEKEIEELLKANLAQEKEMARTVEDVLSRRTRCLLFDAKASIEAAPRTAALLAKELGRDAEWECRQVDDYTELARGYLMPLRAS